MVRAHSLYPDHCTLTTACCCGACIAPSYVCKLPKDEPYCAGHYVCPKGRRAGMHMMGSSGAYRQHTGPYAGGGPTACHASWTLSASAGDRGIEHPVLLTPPRSQTAPVQGGRNYLRRASRVWFRDPGSDALWPSGP